MRTLAGAVELCGGLAHGVKGQWLALGLCLLASSASALDIEQVKREAPAKSSSIEKTEQRTRVLEKTPAEPHPDHVSSTVPADRSTVTGSPRHRGRQPATYATDEILPAYTPSLAAMLPAVDGLNAKISGFGGAADGQALYGGEGSVSVPLGHRYGFQLDGVIAGVDSEFEGEVTVGGAAGHVFWRDPLRGLIGLYGHYLHADVLGGIDVYAGALEGALYLGRFTVEGVAGVEGGEVDRGSSGGADIDTRFFDVAQFAYYPTDNLKLSVGHSYMLGENAALFGAEWGLGSGRRAMTALYARGGVFEGGDAAVLGGLRIYFGQRDKTLIRRHREDDPTQVGDAISNLISEVNSMRGNSAH